METELIILGTGSAFPEHSYHTCFILRTPGLTWMVDAGGGNGVLDRLRASSVAVADIKHLFISHAHTDHILGAVWVVRSVINLARDGRYEEPLNIYGNSDVIETLTAICRMTLLESHYNLLLKIARFHTVSDGDEIRIGDTEISFIDCGSENVMQTGFRMTLPSGKTIVCLGDEALTERNSPLAADADWLLCGAFCRYADRDIFKPYEKHHLTVRDVAINAEKAKVKNLLLYHCEDRDLKHRQELYTAEARPHYTGNIHIPTDGIKIKI